MASQQSSQYCSLIIQLISLQVLWAIEFFNQFFYIHDLVKKKKTHSISVNQSTFSFLIAFLSITALKNVIEI